MCSSLFPSTTGWYLEFENGLVLPLLPLPRKYTNYKERDMWKFSKKLVMNSSQLQLHSNVWNYPTWPCGVQLLLANLFQRATTMAAIAGSSLFKAAAGIATGGLLGVAYKLDQEVSCLQCFGKFYWFCPPFLLITKQGAPLNIHMYSVEFCSFCVNNRYIWPKLLYFLSDLFFF